MESQALAIAAALPEAIDRVFTCGAWAEQGRRGHFRLVLVAVSGGAGTEVYLQRIVEPLGDSSQELRVLATVPVRELNDDHGQYAVSAARCVGNNTVELRATFEHDVGNVDRRIRLALGNDGQYRISNVVVGVSKSKAAERAARLKR